MKPSFPSSNEAYKSGYKARYWRFCRRFYRRGRVVLRAVAANFVAGLLGKARAGLDFILPPRCALCHVRLERHGHLCPACFGHMEPLTAPYCACCGLAFRFDGDFLKTGSTALAPAITAIKSPKAAKADAIGQGPKAEISPKTETKTETETETHLCGTCLVAKPSFRRARAGLHYGGAARFLLLYLKNGGREAALPMARFLLPHLSGLGPIDALVPVPLHPLRFLRRRYNQSVLLAEALQRLARQQALENPALRQPLSVRPDYLKRIRATKNQGPLGRDGRFRNVRGAFKVPDALRADLKDKSLVLIDDVMTTGATVEACSKALLKAGARCVSVLTVARVDLGQDLD